MSWVIEAVCDEMTRLIQCADRFNNNSAVQVNNESGCDFDSGL